MAAQAVMRGNRVIRYRIGSPNYAAGRVRAVTATLTFRWLSIMESQGLVRRDVKIRLCGQQMTALLCTQLWQRHVPIA